MLTLSIQVPSCQTHMSPKLLSFSKSPTFMYSQFPHNETIDIRWRRGIGGTQHLGSFLEATNMIYGVFIIGLIMQIACRDKDQFMKKNSMKLTY